MGVRLPYIVQDIAKGFAVGRQCSINISSMNPFSTRGDLTSWIQVSLAAAVLDAVCARRGLEGRMDGIGKKFRAFAIFYILALTLATV